MPDRGPEHGTAAVLLSSTRARIALWGELDLACRTEVEQAVKDCLRARLPVDLDVRNVKFMDSSILSLVAGLTVRAPVRVIGANELVQFLFDVTGLTSGVEMLDADPGFH